MIKILKYTFCILAVLCAAAIFPVGALAGWTYAIYCALGMAVFAALLMLFKDGNPFRRRTLRQTDFMNSEEENAEILAERANVASEAEDFEDTAEETTEQQEDRADESDSASKDN